MIEQGLIKELLDFHDRYNKQRIHDGQLPDYTKGIFQTLGFKEFHEYLMLSEEARESPGGQTLLQMSIEKLKLATNRYSRWQYKVVKGRFLNHPHREVPKIFELDVTDLSKWSEIEEKAAHIIECHLENKPCKYEPLSSNISDEKKSQDVMSKNYCEVCQRVFIGDLIYKSHLDSFRHKKVLKKKQQLSENKKETGE